MATDPRLRMLFVALGAVSGLTLMGGCQTNVAAGVTPVAVVGGDQTVNPHEKAILDGTGSYVPGQPTAQLTYQWTLVSAPGTSTVALTGATTPVASLTPVVPGLYVVRLVVSYGGAKSAPAYVDVATFENPLPPIANAGPDQTVDPGVTVTLDGTGSSDPSGSALSYKWSYINGPSPTLNLNGSASAKATFVAPGPVGAYVFTLEVTDAHNLTSSDTVIVNVRDVAPVARITGPTSAPEGTTVNLSGTTSSDPNGDKITGYSWTVVKSDVIINLSSNTGPTTSFAIPSLCGPNLSATVSLVVTANGKQSQVATKTIGLNDVINDPPTANAGPNQTVAENVKVTLDGSGSSDCNGDSITYKWAQQSGPPVTLSSTTAVSPTFTSPRILRQRKLVFQLTVADGRGGTAKASVTITENDTIDEPPVAVATATSPVPVQSTATLDGSSSHDPNPGDTLSYTWTQTGGTGVTLSSTSVAKPTFTTPSKPTTLGFKLVVNDGRGKTSSATVSVVVKVGAPDPLKSTLTIAKGTIPADGSTTDLVTVTLKDGAGNGLPGHTVVVEVTPAGLGISQVTLTDKGGGVYTGNLTAGTVAGQGTVRFTVDGSSPYPSTKPLTLQPGSPAGTISLTANPTSIAADGISTSAIATTAPITDAHGNTVLPGTEITVGTTRGAITTPDIDSGRTGIQVATNASGNISFTLKAGTTTGTATETASSVLGSATGSTTVTLTPPEPAPPLTLTPSPSTLVADGTSTSTVTSGLVTDVNGTTVAQGTLVTLVVTHGTITTPDASGTISGIQVKVDATGHISFTVKAGTTATPLTITAYNLSGTKLGSTVISLNPGPANGTITLTANPTSIAADRTSTTTVTSSTITDANGNTVQDGTPVAVTAGGGCAVTSPQSTTNGVITFTVGPCTNAGSVTIGATVAAASGSTSITVTPGPAAVLVFTGQPSNVPMNAAISPAVQVSVEDSNGNVLTGSTMSITVTLTGGTAGATLGGTTTVAAVNGVATFANLTVDTAGTAYQLQANGGGLPAATSTAFDVSNCTFGATLTATSPAGTTTALPWDTIVLNPVGTQTCGQAVTVTYSVSPTPASGGFGAWGSLTSGTYTAPSASAAVPFYTADPQTYTFTLKVTGTSTATATATVTVEQFVALPYGGSSNASAADSRGLALDPSTGNVMIAIQGNGSQAAGQVYRPASLNYTTIDIGCLSGNHGRSPVFDGTYFWMAYDDTRKIDQITKFFNTCTTVTETPVATQGSNPSKTRAMTFMNNVIYMATDKDLFGWDLGKQAFTEYDITTAFGNDHDYSAISQDLAGNVWWASNNNSPDGAAESVPPPDANATRLNYLAGTDDKIRCAVGGQDLTGTDQMWLGTDGNGLIEVPDVTSPASGTQIKSGGNYDNVRGGAYDADSHDVWFATQAGLLRYKSDVGKVALIPVGTAGIGAFTDSYAVLFDEGNGRGRILFYATNIGVFYATAP